MSEFVMPPKVVKEMEAVIAEAVSTYIFEFTQRMFPEPLSQQAHDTILAGIARGVRAYQERVGQPVAQTLAFNLLDIAKEPKQ